MKATFIPLLLLPLLVIASGPKTPWWDPFGKPQPVKSPLPVDSPVPEENLSIANEVSPTSMIDDMWFYGSNHGQKSSALSDKAPEECASGGASTSESACIPVNDEMNPAQTTKTTPSRKKHVHQKENHPVRAIGIPNPLIDVHADIAESSASGAEKNRVDPNSQSKSVVFAETSNSSGDEISETTSSILKTGISGFWSEEYVLRDSRESDTLDASNPSKKNTGSKSSSNDVQSDKPSTVGKIKNVSTSIFNKLKGVHSMIAKPWVPKESEQSEHDNSDLESGVVSADVSDSSDSKSSSNDVQSDKPSTVGKIKNVSARIFNNLKGAHSMIAKPWVPKESEQSEHDNLDSESGVVSADTSNSSGNEISETPSSIFKTGISGLWSEQYVPWDSRDSDTKVGANPFKKNIKKKNVSASKIKNGSAKIFNKLKDVHSMIAKPWVPKESEQSEHDNSGSQSGVVSADVSDSSDSKSSSNDVQLDKPSTVGKIKNVSARIFNNLKGVHSMIAKPWVPKESKQSENDNSGSQSGVVSADVSGSSDKKISESPLKDPKAGKPGIFSKISKYWEPSKSEKPDEKSDRKGKTVASADASEQSEESDEKFDRKGKGVMYETLFANSVYEIGESSSKGVPSDNPDVDGNIIKSTPSENKSTVSKIKNVSASVFNKLKGIHSVIAKPWVPKESEEFKNDNSNSQSKSVVSADVSDSSDEEISESSSNNVQLDKPSTVSKIKNVSTSIFNKMKGVHSMIAKPWVPKESEESKHGNSDKSDSGVSTDASNSSQDEIGDNSSKNALSDSKSAVIKVKNVSASIANKLKGIHSVIAKPWVPKESKESKHGNSDSQSTGVVSADVPDSSDKEITDSSSNDVQLDKPSTISKIKNVSTGIFNKLKGIHSVIAKPWVPKDSDQSKHENSDSQFKTVVSVDKGISEGPVTDVQLDKISNDSEKIETSEISSYSDSEKSDHDDPNSESEIDEFTDASDCFDDEIDESHLDEPSIVSETEGIYSQDSDDRKPINSETSTSDGQITKNLSKDGKPRRSCNIKAAATYVKNACVNCVKGIFGKGKKEEEKSDHTLLLEDGKPRRSNLIQSAASHVKNACSFGVNCVKGIFDKGKKEEEKSDHNSGLIEADSSDNDISQSLSNDAESDKSSDKEDISSMNSNDWKPISSQTSASDGEESEISPIAADDMSTKDGKPKKPSRIQAAASYIKDACAFGVNCVKGIFGKGKKDDNNSDHTSVLTDTLPSEQPTHNTNAPAQTGPIPKIKTKKTWADKIMELPPHERFVLFRAGSSYNLDEPTANSPGLFYRVGQFCKCVLGTIAEVPLKLGKKFVDHLKGPMALENAETTSTTESP